MLTDHYFRIDEGRARFPGVNFGYGDSDPFIIAQTARFMVLYRKPVGDWLCRGESKSYPARYYLIEYAEHLAGHKRFEGCQIVARCLAEEEPGSRWRSMRRLLIERMGKLEEGQEDG